MIEFSKYSVLIVDDEKSNIMMLTEILKDDYTIYAAKGGRTALEAANKYVPDIILLDIIMPDMDGFEVLTELKKNKKTEKISVIFVTGLNSRTDEAKGLELGIADYITKPFSPAIVRLRVGNQVKILEQFRSNAHWYKSILDAIPIPIHVTDTQMNWTFVNKAVEVFLGSRSGDLIGRHCSLMNTSICNTENCGIASAKRGIKRTFYDNNELSYQVDIETILDRDGNVVGFVEIVQDVTKVRQLAKQSAEAEMTSRAKTAFLATMSHEMRTPMNVVVSLTNIMLEEADPTVNLTANLHKINTAGNTLLGLINDILDISKIEAGKLDLVPVQYEVPSILSDVVTLNIIRIEEKPIEFKLDINEKLMYQLLGDELRVKQILNNLLSNAFKYTQKGSVTLGMTTEREGNDVWMNISVIDTGIGIRQEDLKKLFTDYGQMDPSANRLIEGTGLGLSITKRLIEMMDGEITVESEYGKGTVFNVRIKQGFVSGQPIGESLAKNLRGFDDYTLNKRNAEKKQITCEDLSSARVLVVDDIPINLDIAVGVLGRYKMQIDCVGSGEEAVEKIRSGDPVYNAIFMDHMMPVMDGIEAADNIRKLDSDYAKEIPIIALTANAIQGMDEIFYSHGFQGFLSKPINLSQLDVIVKKWISSSGEGCHEK